jgi:hypothetical protein
LVTVPTPLKRWKIVGRTHARGRHECQFGTSRLRPTKAHTREMLYCWPSTAITQVHRVYWAKFCVRIDAVVVMLVAMLLIVRLVAIDASSILPIPPIHPFTPVSQALSRMHTRACECVLCEI